MVSNIHLTLFFNAHRKNSNSSLIFQVLITSGSVWVKHFVPERGASLVAQMINNLPAMWERWVQSLGWEDLLEKGMATHSSIHAWRTPWTEEPSGLQSMGSKRVRHDWATNTHTHTHTHQKEKHAPLLTASVTKPHEVQIPVPLLLASTWTFLGLFCVPRGLMKITSLAPFPACFPAWSTSRKIGRKESVVCFPYSCLPLCRVTLGWWHPSPMSQSFVGGPSHTAVSISFLFRFKGSLGQTNPSVLSLPFWDPD